MISFLKSMLFTAVLIFSISLSEAENQNGLQQIKKEMRHDVILLEDIHWDSLLGKPLDNNIFEAKGIRMLCQFEPGLPRLNKPEFQDIVISSGEYIFEKDSKKYRVFFEIKEIYKESNKGEVVSYDLKKNIIM